MRSQTLAAVIWAGGALPQSPLQSIAAGHLSLAVLQLLQGPCALAGNLYFD